MRALLRRLTLAAVALGAAVAFFLIFTLPPRALALDGDLPSNLTFGAYHVHSVRSDGTGTVDEIAAAASDAGLSFVILTDHGDATRQPDPPSYLHGVLVIDAVEINTDGGHLVALGLSDASPYPLAGQTVDVIDDVHRQGGWVVVAHPDSGRPGLRWSAGQTGQDAVEWLNADSEWRDNTTAEVVMAGARSLFRSAESVVSLFDRPEQSLTRWDRMTRSREVVGLAATDAHGGIPRGDRDGRAWIRVPSYSGMFGAIAQGVVLESPLSGQPAADGRAVLAALEGGRTFSIVHALARPAALEFTASTLAGSGEVAHMGGRLEGSGEPLVVRAALPQAPGVRLVLLRHGEPVASGRGSVEYSGPYLPGAYRVEAAFPTAAVPWIVSNPIYVGPRSAAVTPERPVSDAQIVDLAADARWTVERDSQSTGAVSIDDDTLEFEFGLGDGAPSGQYAALVAPVESDEGFDRVRFTAVSDRPMRLSLQLRLPGGQDGLRWRKSVYIDSQPRTIIVRVEDLEPVGGMTSQQPIVARIRSILFVVDTINTLPGTNGSVRLSDVGLGVGDVTGESGASF